MTYKKHPLALIAVIAVITLVGCASHTARDGLTIQDPSVLKSGLNATQDYPAGAPDARWLKDVNVVPSNPSAIEAMQKRLSALPTPSQPYFHAKAQCWVDYAKTERGLHNQWGIVNESLLEANRLITDMEQGRASNPANQPLRTSVQVRPDLWEKLNRIKADQRFKFCPPAQKEVACSEVELVAAGHDAWARGFDDAKRKADNVANAMTNLQASVDACKVPAPPVAIVKPQPVIEPVPKKIVLSADALFDFNKADIKAIEKEDLAKMDALVLAVNDPASDVRKLTINGYTDHLGSAAYNRQLSERRATSVEHYLHARGIKVNMQTRGLGATQPVATCTQKNREELIHCLRPNRRVEIVIN